MTILFSLSIIIICYLLYSNQKQKLLLVNYQENALEAFSSHEDMKETLRIGLYNRFKRDLEMEKEGNPLLFEQFAAEIITTVRGARTYVTKGSGDFGIDIEEHSDEGLYLGQVKCYSDQNLVGFDPIAIVHSQMIKQGAAGGYVITTSDFSSNAYTYAKGLNIDLINGKQVVDLWLDYLDAKHDHINGLQPIPQMQN